ncbi:MAG TPA: vanadium-dependent haloperoxidase [Acidimicrobiia bacterium]|nr:vanadium-dependent haloperoxidase [Acidimicrobiia bacterium]
MSSRRILDEPLGFFPDHPVPKEEPRPLEVDRVACGVSRRALLGSTGGLLAAFTFGDVLVAKGPLREEPESRLGEAVRLRMEAAQAQQGRGRAEQHANGDERELSDYLGCFTKALPHDGLGIVDSRAYEVLLEALERGEPEAFESVPLGGYAKLANPQAAFAFDLVGPDPVQVACPPAPRFSSAETAGEMAEVYWHALLRDVAFSRYGSDGGVARACEDLSRFSDFRGPKRDERVVPATLFRGPTEGDLVGPYVSQFLWKRIPYLPMWVDQAMRTAVPRLDYLDRYERWLEIQNGALGGVNRFEQLPLYVRNGRDLGEYVHRDFSYQAFLGACLMLFKFGVPSDGGNPYKHSRTQSPFATFGQPYALYLLAVVAHLAFKASWYQKWLVHRRLRPEELAGRVHNHLAGRARHPIHSDLLESAALEVTEERQGNHLLCTAYPEGCPIHPSYPAAHAVVAGACVTILKALFDESYVVPEPVEATPDGRELHPYGGPPLTVGGELDKLASNISIGRDFAGVHYRSDATAGLALGEELALAVLAEARATGNELFAGFSIRRFDGRRVEV